MLVCLRLWMLVRRRVPPRGASPRLPGLARSIEPPEDGWRLKLRWWHLRGRLACARLLPPVHRIVERWWRWWWMGWMRRLPMPGDKRRRWWWGPPHARVGLLLLLLEERIRRRGALRELTLRLALCTRELRIERRNLRGQSEEASDPPEGVRRGLLLLLLPRHARCWCGGGSWPWPSGAASAGRLVRVRCWRGVGLEDRATTVCMGKGKGKSVRPCGVVIPDEY